MGVTKLAVYNLFPNRHLVTATNLTLLRPHPSISIQRVRARGPNYPYIPNFVEPLSSFACANLCLTVPLCQYLS